MAAVLAAIVIWQIAASAIGNSLLLAAPFVVVQKLLQLCASMDFWGTILFTMSRIFAGFILGLAAGTILAVLSGRFRIMEVLLQPYIVAIKSTPVASFIVLFLIWLSAKSLSVFISFMMVFPIVYTNVLQGIKSTDEKLLEMADLFRVKWWRRIHYIYIPHLKPYLLSACSLAIGMSWKAGVAAELIGIPEGSIGERLYEAKVYLSSSDLFAWTVVIIVISILFEKLFIYFLKAFFRLWVKL